MPRHPRLEHSSADKAALLTKIAEVDPALVEIDGRLEDRLRLDVEGLKESIAQNGQRIPILLRPIAQGRYRLIYGRRRLEAMRQLGHPVRAIITELNDQEALKDQLLENSERRDLSFIERALVAKALLEGNLLQDSQSSAKSVAEILNLTEAGVSQLLGIVRVLAPELIETIGPAPSIGRPRWEELKKAVALRPDLHAPLLDRALQLRQAEQDSDLIFAEVLAYAKGTPVPSVKPPNPPKPILDLGEAGNLSLKSTFQGKKLQIEVRAKDADFVSWLQDHAPKMITELHERWQHSEEKKTKVLK